MTDPHTIQSIDAAGRHQECDLIMKGGVTSGLVYPGAIGAVAAAAMEYGLRTGRNWPGCTKNWPSAPIRAPPGLMPCSAAIRAPRLCSMR